MAAWVVAAAAVTAALWALRPALDKAHMALAFLLLVLWASAWHGRRVGLLLATSCFLAFNFFLIPPYHTLRVADPLDWVVLAAFLITAAVAAQLLYGAQRQARLAQQRAEEIDRLSVLGAETLNAADAEDAVAGMARVIRSTLRLAGCEVWVRSEESGPFRRIVSLHAGRDPAAAADEVLFDEVVGNGVVGVEPVGAPGLATMDGVERLAAALQEHPGATGLLLPLTVRGRGLGLLRLSSIEPIRLDEAQQRFARVLAYYTALGVERILLVAEADNVRALREADRLREALIAGVSHDLRTPLTTIKALAFELRATGDERAVVIEEEVDRLNTLVADLLDLSRLRAGALTSSPELVAAEDLIGTAIQRVEGARDGRDILVTLPHGEVMPVGWFDFAHGLRALANLLENALKYSPPRSPVEVVLTREGSVHVFAVHDRGPGVPPDEADRIFEPFYRLPGAGASAGTGLGLAIARRLAEAEGGGVRYLARPGGGSTFLLTLPAAEVPFDDPAATAPSGRPVS